MPWYLQVFEHASVSMSLPSSHSSGGSRLPSPQTTSLWQVAEQPSPFSVFPSSHVSPVSTLPLPQNGPQVNEHTPATQHGQSLDSISQQGSPTQPRAAARCMRKNKADQEHAQIT